MAWTRVLVWVRMSACLLLWCLCVREAKANLCDFSQCNCTLIAGKWTTAICVFNSSQRQLDVTAESLPRTLKDLEISGPRETVLYNGSFSRNLTGLNLVRVADVGSLTVGTKAFARVAHPHLRLEVSGAQRVILESHAFHALRGSVVSVRLERVDHLIVMEHAFDRLLELNIRRVGLLELHPHAFFFESDKRNLGPATKITLEGVRVRELPCNVFPVLNRLVIADSEVGVVRASAFRALVMNSVQISNSSVRELETEAFTTRNSIGQLELRGVTLGVLRPNSVQCGISHLTVHGSSLSDVWEAAFNTIVANVSLTQNVFDRVRSRGLTFKDTSSLTVENNRFNVLEDSALVLPADMVMTGQTINVTFRGNSLGREVGRDALDFPRSRAQSILIGGNNWDQPCHCEGHVKSWLRERVNGSETVVDDLYVTGDCQVTPDLARCFGLSVGTFSMDNFSTLVCHEDSYYCPEVVQSDAADSALPGITSDIVYDGSTDRERKILGSVFVFVISGIVVMLIFSGLMWLRRRGYCAKARQLLPSAESLVSRLCSCSATTPAPTHTVPTAHEYAELQTHKVAEDEVSLEDKATQTLPEELTQELLQSLRDKLDDPDNYSEARDMIEHLYDLIKVEESCNQNSEQVSLQLEEPEGDNVYDVIRPRVRRARGSSSVSQVSVGTRVPSLDQLAPPTLSRRPAVPAEYAQPRDLAVPDHDHHVYQELDSARHHALATRPLPPPVI